VTVLGSEGTYGAQEEPFEVKRRKEVIHACNELGHSLVVSILRLEGQFQERMGAGQLAEVRDKMIKCLILVDPPIARTKKSPATWTRAARSRSRPNSRGSKGPARCATSGRC